MSERTPEQSLDDLIAGSKVTRRQVLKWSGTLAVTSLAAPILAACGGETGGGATPTSGTTGGNVATPEAPQPTPVATTNVSGWNPRFKDKATVSRFGFGTDNTTARVRVQAFEQAYPNITLKAAPEIDDQKILTAVASGDVPDLFWLGRNTVLSWAARKALEPMDDLIKNDDRFKLDNFYEAAVKEVQYEGQTWAIPQFMDARPIFVSLEPLRQAGLKVENIDTSDWQQLREFGEKLTKKQSNKITRWGFDTKVQSGFLWMYSWGNGSSLLSDDGKTATFDTPENIEALKYTVDTMNSQGGFRSYKAFLDTTQFEGPENFIVKNQVVMTPFESWLLGIIAEGDPKHEFRALPFKGKNGDIISMSGGNAWAIPKGAKNKEAAWEFISFMSDADIWRKAGEAEKKETKAAKGVYIPSLTANKAADKMLREEVYTSTTPAIDEAVDLFPQLLEQSKQVVASPVLKEITDILQSEAVDPALQGSKQPDAAMKDAQQKAQRALDKFYK